MNLPINTETANSLSDKISKLVIKLKKDKKALLIITLGILGMILILFSGEDSDIKAVKATEVSDTSVYDAETVKNELKELIESISGAGNTKVMITYKSDKETVFAANSEETIRSGETKNKKEYVIIKENSDETGMPLKIIYPEIRGVAVICEGGDNQIVREKIFSLISALFDISSNSISVSSMA